MISTLWELVLIPAALVKIAAELVLILVTLSAMLSEFVLPTVLR